MLQPRRNNQATKQDSIAVKEDSKRILNEYLAKGYKPTNVKFPNETLDETLLRAQNKIGTTEVIRNNVRKPEKYNSSDFRTDINENQYRQRESANGVLNMDITPALYDKRIKPVRTINLMGTESGTYNDGVSIPSYDTMEIASEKPTIAKVNPTIIKPNTNKVKEPIVEVKKAANIIKPINTRKPSIYTETLKPQTDTLSQETLGLNKLKKQSTLAIETLNIVKPRK